MRFSEYQLKAAQTAIYPGQGTAEGLVYCLLGLGNESGEVQGKYKKVIRDNNGKLSPEKINLIAEECGDVLWYLAMICNELNLPFEKIASDNLYKLASRKEHGTIQGSGDNR